MGITVYAPAPLLANEDERRAAVDASGALNVAGDDELRAIVATARQQFDTACAAISIIYEDWQYLIAANGMPEGVYSRRTSFCGHVLCDPGHVLDIPDASHDGRFADNPVVTADQGVRSYAGAALVDDRGYALGSLCVFDWRPRPPLDRVAAARLQSLARAAMDRLDSLADRKAA